MWKSGGGLKVIRRRVAVFGVMMDCYLRGELVCDGGEYGCVPVL